MKFRQGRAERSLTVTLKTHNKRQPARCQCIANKSYNGRTMNSAISITLI